MSLMKSSDSITIETPTPYTPIAGTSKIEVAASGDSGIRKGFAAVLHGTPTCYPKHPWESSVGAFVFATPDANGLLVFNQDGGNPVPGARGSCQEDTLIVWGLFGGDACFKLDKQTIQVGTDCGGSSSSSGQDRQLTWPPKEMLSYELTGSLTAQVGDDQDLPSKVTFRKLPDRSQWIWEDPKGGRIMYLLPLEQQLVLITIGSELEGVTYAPIRVKDPSLKPLQLEFKVQPLDSTTNRGFTLTVTE